MQKQPKTLHHTCIGEYPPPWTILRQNGKYFHRHKGLRSQGKASSEQNNPEVSCVQCSVQRAWPPDTWQYKNTTLTDSPVAAGWMRCGQAEWKKIDKLGSHTSTFVVRFPNRRFGQCPKVNFLLLSMASLMKCQLFGNYPAK